MFDLLAAALRQRPQYLMVGEVRGAEAFIVFQAMATGKTCYTTFHAEASARWSTGWRTRRSPLPRSLVSRAEPRPVAAAGEGREQDDPPRLEPDGDRRTRPGDERADHELGLLVERGRRHVPLLGPLVHLRAGRDHEEPHDEGDGAGGPAARRDPRVHEVARGARDPPEPVHPPRRRAARLVLLQGAPAGARRGPDHDGEGEERRQGRGRRPGRRSFSTAARRAPVPGTVPFAHVVGPTGASVDLYEGDALVGLPTVVEARVGRLRRHLAPVQPRRSAYGAVRRRPPSGRSTSGGSGPPRTWSTGSSRPTARSS